MLKFWAFIYRTTGYYSNYATLKEYKHVQSVIENLPSPLDLAQDDLSVENWVSIQIGMWQVRNGFYRTYKSKYRRS
jgi:hypothetical protein